MKAVWHPTLPRIVLVPDATPRKLPRKLYCAKPDYSWTPAEIADYYARTNTK